MNGRIQRRWNLIFWLIQLSVITVMFVLPQVDLLDTAFQNDSGPLAIHAFALTSPFGVVTGVMAGVAVTEAARKEYG